MAGMQATDKNGESIQLNSACSDNPLTIEISHTEEFTSENILLKS